MEKAEHEDKLAGMEELETEHVGDEDESDEGAQLSCSEHPSLNLPWHRRLGGLLQRGQHGGGAEQAGGGVGWGESQYNRC